MSEVHTDSTHDVIIVGAGIIGATVAYHLAKQGVRSLILEQCGKHITSIRQSSLVALYVAVHMF